MSDDIDNIKSQLAAMEAEIASLAVKLAQADDPAPPRPVIDPAVEIRHAFRVRQTGKDTVSVAAGYAQGQTSSLTSVSAVAAITATAAWYIWARYDMGLAGTSSPGWEVASGSIIQSGASLPSPAERFRVIPIAELTWAAGAIASILQHHTGVLPCPDMELPGKVQPWNVPHGTTIYGWKPCDGTNTTVDVRKKFISGAHGSGNLAAGGETTIITAASLNAAQTAHSHSLGTSGLSLIQEGTTGIFDPYTDTLTAEIASFASDLTPAIIPPNVAMPYYEHL